MSLGDLDRKFVIIEANWEYNDCWYERDGFLGKHPDMEVFNDYYEARDKCYELNFSWLVENINQINCDCLWSLKDLLKTDLNTKSTTLIEFHEGERMYISLKENVQKGNKEKVARRFMELGFCKYEIMAV